MSSKDKIFSAFKIIAKGKTIMAVYSYTMIVLSVYCTVKTVPMDSAVAGAYALVSAYYTYTKTRTNKNGQEEQAGVQKAY